MATSNKFASFNLYEGLLVHVKFGNQAPTEAEFNEFLEGLSSILDKQKKFTLFVDTSEMAPVPFAFSLTAAMFLRKHRPRFREYCMASAIFIQSELVRGLLDAVFTIQPPVSPNKIVGDADEGMQFLETFMTPVSA